MNLEQRISKTIEWIQAQVNNAGLKGVIVGLSGGIDSALASCLMKEAFPNNSLAVILPIKSSQSSITDAQALAQKIKIDTMTIDLTEHHERLLNHIVKEAGNNEKMLRITDANLRARLRMVTIYSIASLYNYMVIGTDNAAEIYTGYFTKFGDGGCDIMPLAPLLKSEVYEWAKYMGVPNSLIEKAPSADLWENQTDEQEMGTTYKMIDSHLQGIEIPEKDKLIIEGLHKRSEHKRHTPVARPRFK